ncbi:TniQ family protein [Nitrospirillum sp. BR 11164]|uniref:TniQ family protein n=1 Tax=Nitrospirillum sp. BR 11164 TaxID=3104324 RepID=UPI002B002D08|nr:TniQ family protein [Nitrospirillum sp. BR 11164]MEA1653029.1 TniQ family protein [Nitrospirillum sp. BR 11164]
MTVPLGDREPATSFASRLARRNGCINAWEFCEDMGLKYSLILKGDPTAIAEIARLGGVDAEKLACHTFRRPNLRIVEIGQEIITRTELFRSGIRFCPDCVSSDLAAWPHLGAAAPYQRPEWHLTTIRTCTEHGRALVSFSQLSPRTNRGDFSQAIGEALRELDTPSTHAVLRSPSQLERYLLARLSGRHNKQRDWLDHFPLYAAARLTEVVGCTKLYGLATRRGLLTDDQLQRAGSAGWDILKDGPAGFERFLEGPVKAFWSSRHDAGPKSLLGPMYEWLAENDTDPAYHLAREVISAFLLRTIPFGVKNRVFGTPVGRRRIWSIHTLAKETKQHPKRLRKLLITRGIIGRESAELSDHRVTFPADNSVSDFLEEIGELMSQKAARAYLKTSRSQMAVLIRADTLVPYATEEGSVAIRPLFLKRHLDDFLRRLTIDAISTAIPPSRSVNIPKAAKAARTSAAAVVDLLLRRRLIHVSRDPDLQGYFSILVDPAEVRDRLRDATFSLAESFSGPTG